MKTVPKGYVPLDEVYQSIRERTGLDNLVKTLNSEANELRKKPLEETGKKAERSNESALEARKIWYKIFLKNEVTIAEQERELEGRFFAFIKSGKIEVFEMDGQSHQPALIKKKWWSKTEQSFEDGSPVINFMKDLGYLVEKDAVPQILELFGSPVKGHPTGRPPIEKTKAKAALLKLFPEGKGIASWEALSTAVKEELGLKTIGQSTVIRAYQDLQREGKMPE